MSKGLFGRVDVKSFIEYKASKANANKGKFNKKKRGGQKKDEDNDDGEVVISIGLMVWDVNEEVLKEKRGKRLALRVPKSSNYKTLLEKAVDKWKNFHNNLYEEGKEYTILLQDGQEAIFLPGSRKEFFSLKRYKEELLKDYKRLTFFLCSTEDLEARNGDTKEQWNDDRSEDEDLPHKRKKREECDYARAEPSGTQAVGVAGPSGIQPDLVTSDSEEIQINSDEQVAWSLQEELNKEMNAGGSNHLVKAADYSTIDDEAGVLNALEEKVIRDKKSLFLVVRRGTPLERVLNLWHRETLKISPDHELRIKFLGEDGIDSGALSKEFLTKTVVDIAQKFFPNGSPVHSTNEVQNGNFRACGEIVATSLAQGGPPPCFLAETVYDTLVLESDIDFSSVSPEQHLTSTERELLQQIQSDVLQHQDTIFEHGYTGVVDEAHLESITASIVVSMLSRRILCLKEFKKGLELYGLSSILSKYPDITRGLFVMGKQTKVDANYLFSLMAPEFSPQGSSHRCTEEQVMDHFQDFLLSLEDDKVTGYAEPVAWKAEDDLNVLQQSPPDDKEMEQLINPDLTPAGVLGWLTGQKHREITKSDLGITVKFDHDCLKRNPEHRVCFPSVGACGRTITFPVCHMESFEKFKEIFLLAFCKGQTFAMR